MKEAVNVQYYKSPYGELLLGSYKDQLCLCDWRYRKMRAALDSRIQKGLMADYKEQNAGVTSDVIVQLEEYFNKQRTVFDIPLLFVGTDFQKTVWNMLLQIPYGSTETYSGLSERLNNKAAIRAVASANGANAISVIVPCHRIIGSDRKLVGYAGGLEAKRKLLQLESGSRVVQLTLF